MPDLTEFTDSEQEEEDFQFAEDYDDDVDEDEGFPTTKHVCNLINRLRSALNSPTADGDRLLWLLKQNNWWFYHKVTGVFLLSLWGQNCQGQMSEKSIVL